MLSFFDYYRIYNSCLISFLNSCEIFPAVNWAKENGNLQRIFCGVNIFNLCPCRFCLLIFFLSATLSLCFVFSYWYTSFSRYPGKLFFSANALMMISLLLCSFIALFITLFCDEIIFLLCVFVFAFFIASLLLFSLLLSSSPKTKFPSSFHFFIISFCSFAALIMLTFSLSKSIKRS